MTSFDKLYATFIEENTMTGQIANNPSSASGANKPGFAASTAKAVQPGQQDPNQPAPPNQPNQPKEPTDMEEILNSLVSDYADDPRLVKLAELIGSQIKQKETQKGFVANQGNQNAAQ